jgi:dienelactone hydrolase
VKAHHLLRACLAAAFALSAAGATAAQAAEAPSSAAHARAAALLEQQRAGLPQDQVIDCLAPAGDPAPGTPEWQRRDTINQYCATLRLRDQLASPAYGWGNLTSTTQLWLERTVDQASDPSNPRGGFTTLVPGSQAADAFRTLKRWTEAGRGRVAPVSFESINGATLRGHVFAPPARVRRPKAGFPGVVITDGSVQAYEELYFWAAQDLAEAGYVVMTYDVQGQGDSDLAGDDCPGECTGVPYQQSYNFHQGAEDSLNAFLDARNPYLDLLDRRRVGIAGHSLGAAAVSQVGQCDRRVKAIVAWDNLDPIEDCDGVTIPAKHRASELIRTPALGIANDYLFNTQPAFRAPDPQAKADGYQQLKDAGVDTQSIVLRGATHLEYTYIPLVLPASQKGERFASYYTRAWFDKYLKGDRTAARRLTATTFDDSVDRSAIGTGEYDPAAAAAAPADRYAGNVPHRIAGIPVANALSFYYHSQYAMGRGRCDDMRHGCRS